MISYSLGFAAASKSELKDNLRARLQELRGMRMRTGKLELSRKVRAGTYDFNPELFDQKVCIASKCRKVGGPGCEKYPVFYLCSEHTGAARCHECNAAKK